MFLLVLTPSQGLRQVAAGAAPAAVGQCWSACGGCSVSLCAVECVSVEEPCLSDGAIVCEPQG